MCHRADNDRPSKSGTNDLIAQPSGIISLGLFRNHILLATTSLFQLIQTNRQAFLSCFPKPNMSSLPSTHAKKKSASLSTNTILLLIGASAVSFIAGNMFAMSFNECSSLSSPAMEEVKGQKEENFISVARESASILYRDSFWASSWLVSHGIVALS